MIKHVKVSQAISSDSSDACHFVEYSLNDEDIDGATATINGRYPSTGYVVNEVCKELVHILSGSGKLCTENDAIGFVKDDQILIEPGEKYYWEGEFSCCMVCTPAFYPEQHKEVE